MANKTFYDYIETNEYYKFNEDEEYNKNHDVKFTNKMTANSNLNDYNYSLKLFDMKNNKEFNRYLFDKQNMKKSNISLLGNTSFKPFQIEPNKLGKLYTDNYHSDSIPVINENIYLERVYYNKNIKNMEKLKKSVQMDYDIMFKSES